MKGEWGFFVLKKEALGGGKGEAAENSDMRKKIRLPQIALGGTEENLGMVGAFSSDDDLCVLLY